MMTWIIQAGMWGTWLAGWPFAARWAYSRDIPSPGDRFGAGMAGLIWPGLLAISCLAKIITAPTAGMVTRSERAAEAQCLAQAAREEAAAWYARTRRLELGLGMQPTEIPEDFRTPDPDPWPICETLGHTLGPYGRCADCDKPVQFLRDLRKPVRALNPFTFSHSLPPAEGAPDER